MKSPPTPKLSCIVVTMMNIIYITLTPLLLLFTSTSSWTWTWTRIAFRDCCSLKSLCDGFGLWPVEEFLLLGCLVVYGEHYLASFTNFETVTDHGLICGSNFPVLLHNDSVSILSAGHKFSYVAHIPTHYSDFPNQVAFLQEQEHLFISIIFSSYWRGEKRKKKNDRSPQKLGTRQHVWMRVWLWPP